MSTTQRASQRAVRKALHGIVPPVITPYRAATHHASLGVGATVSREDGRSPTIPLTPVAHERHVIDDDAFVAHVQWLRSTEACSGLVVGGSNGEYALQTPDERVACVRLCKEALVAATTPQQHRAELPILAGCVMESTSGTVALGSRMLEAGADGLLLLHPAYYKASMTEAALIQFYSDVASAFGEQVPILLYNMPGNTGIDLSAAVVQTLFERHPSIVGIKDSGGNVTKCASMVAAAWSWSSSAHGRACRVEEDDDTSETIPPAPCVVAGSAGFLLPALSVGCSGGICAYANLDPVTLSHLQTAFSSGDLATASAIQLRIVALNTAITATHGVPALKHCMWRRGLLKSAACRSPLLPVSSEVAQSLDALLRKAQLLPE